MNWSKMVLTLSTISLAGCDPVPSNQTSDRSGTASCLVGNNRMSFEVAPPAKEAELAIDMIMQSSGLTPNFAVHSAQFQIATPIAFACQSDGKRFIVYDSAYFHVRANQLTFSDYGILAHEVAHHLLAHTSGISNSDWDNELASDQFAGFASAKLGATLKEAQLMAALFSEDASASHPPREKRLEAIEQGWKRALANS